MKFIWMKNIILKRGKEEISFLLDGKNIIVERPDWISIGEDREEGEEKWRDEEKKTEEILLIGRIIINNNNKQ